MKKSKGKEEREREERACILKLQEGAKYIEV